MRRIGGDAVDGERKQKSQDHFPGCDNSNHFAVWLHRRLGSHPHSPHEGLRATTTTEEPQGQRIHWVRATSESTSPVKRTLSQRGKRAVSDLASASPALRDSWRHNQSGRNRAAFQ